MEITVNRRELLDAVQNAEGMAPSGSVIEALKCVYLVTGDNSLTLASGNTEAALEQSIPARIQEPGSAALNAKLFRKALDLMPGEDVSVSHSSGSLTLSAGETVYTLAGIDPVLYLRTDIPAPEQTITVTGLRTLAKSTVFAAGKEKDLSKAMLNCVSLRYDSQGFRAACTDGFLLAQVQGSEKSAEPLEFLLPAASLEKLAQMVAEQDSLTLGIENQTAVFRKENFAFAARLVSSVYPNVDSLISSFGTGFRVLTDAEPLRKALGLVSVVLSGKGSLSIQFESNQITLSGEGERGISSQVLETVALSGVPTGRYWYDPRKLHACLKALKGTLILEVVAKGVLLLHADNRLYMLIAMREPKRPAEEKKGKGKKRAESAQPEAA